MNRMSEHEVNQYGFRWGQVDVLRHATANGHCWLGVDTERQSLYIRITPTGLIRVGKPVPRKEVA